MPRTTHEPDEDDDWDDDPDDLPEEGDDEGELATIACPYCHREIVEEAQWCPHCENYLSREDAPAERRNWFWVVMMVFALGAALWWALG